jgi:hypothetical protein
MHGHTDIGDGKFFWKDGKSITTDLSSWRLNLHINLLAPDFFLILAHPIYKMWIIQKPNMLELWNNLHFEKKKESIYHV